MITLSILVRVCIWVLGFHKLEFTIWIVVNLFCSCLRLFDVMDALYATDVKVFNDFLMEK